MSDHVSAKTRELLAESDEARCIACRTPRWIRYAEAASVLNIMNELMLFPRSGRMRSVLIAGEPNNGKSCLLDHFMKLHPVTEVSDGSAYASVVRIDVPSTPTEATLAKSILLALVRHYRDRDPASLLKEQAKAALRQNQTRVLVVDEFHHLSSAGRKSGNVLSFLKEISNELGISIVGAGILDAINTLTSEPQLRSRFTIYQLPAWGLNESYLRFLDTYERMLPLKKPSHLRQEAIATRLYTRGKTEIGLTVLALREAAVRAIRTGEECITPEILDSLTQGERDVAIAV